MTCNLKLSGVDDSFKKITTALLKSDDLFKLLKYNESNALDLPITNSDKFNLIDQDDKENRRMIFQPYKKDLISDNVRTEVRIYVMAMNPTNRYIGTLLYGFDIVVHDSIWQLDRGKQRALIIAQEIYKVLNANEVDIIGKLESGNNRMQLRDFQDGFTGYSFMLSAGTA